MNGWQQILEQLGIADITAFANYVIANSKNGPQFKAKAQAALESVQDLAAAAQNPAQ